jgi:hypothetical protein
MIVGCGDSTGKSKRKIFSPRCFSMCRIKVLRFTRTQPDEAFKSCHQGRTSIIAQGESCVFFYITELIDTARDHVVL